MEYKHIEGFDFDKWCENSWDYLQNTNEKIFYNNNTYELKSYNTSLVNRKDETIIKNLDEYKKINKHNFFKVYSFDIINNNIKTMNETERKVFINNISLITDHPNNYSLASWNKDFCTILFENLTVKESLDIIEKIPKKTFKINMGVLENIDSFITKFDKNYDSSDFYFNILNDRKTGLNKQKIKVYVANFINDKFKNSEVINKFENIIPYLKEVNNSESYKIYDDIPDECIVLSYDLEMVQKKYSGLSIAISGYEVLALKLFEEIGKAFTANSVNVIKKDINNDKCNKYICYINGVSLENKSLIAEVFENCFSDMAKLKNTTDIFNNEAINSIVLKNVLDLTITNNNFTKKSKKL